MPARNWCLTDLTAPDALVLTVGGRTFPVVQFSASWAINEIPTAVCVLAVGRDARSAGASVPAAPHTSLAGLVPLTPATVTFRPRGDAAPAAAWTGSREVIFDGLFTGLGKRQVQGKVYLVFHLVHWLAKLGFSSALTAGSHPSNPAFLSDPAIFNAQFGLPRAQGSETGDRAAPSFLPEHVDAEFLEEDIKGDVWKAVRRLFCKVASSDRMDPGCASSCGPTFKQNTPALEALRRIEGPDAGGCKSDSSRWHRPLALRKVSKFPEVLSAVATALNEQRLEAWANSTLWDVLVGQICPMFGMAVVPRVGTALLVADTPAYRTARKEVVAGEQDAYDFSGLTPKPLGAVSVVGESVSETGVEVADRVQGVVCTGGCYYPQGGGDTAIPGAALYVSAPRWLANVASVEPPPKGDAAVATATTRPAKAAQKPKAHEATVSDLYKDYARHVYVAHALRGRSGPFSGPLRFDICPGTILRFKASTEVFVGGYDDLAVDLYGSVNRVTVAINAEAPSASTSFQLTHLRTEAENRSDRTSVAEHPLFGPDVFNGAPLVDAWDF